MFCLCFLSFKLFFFWLHSNECLMYNKTKCK
jgi:hypothetical protein